MMTEPEICIVGCASWDTLLPVDRYPVEGEYCIAADEIQLPGGTSTNTAVALARLGAPPRFVGLVGDDWRGERLRVGLESAGVICDTLATRIGQDSDRSVIPISPSGARTIFWIKGAMLQRGDAIDLPLVFSHRTVYLDVVDMGLWMDILDAYERAQRSGGATPLLIGQAVFVAGILPPSEALRLVGRHHSFIGGEWEWKLITGEATRERLTERLVELVANSALHTAIVTLGAAGCLVIHRDGVTAFPAVAVEVVDTTGAGDAFAAGFVYGLAHQWEMERNARFANAVGGLATRAFGSQAALPTVDEAWQRAFGTETTITHSS